MVFRWGRVSHRHHYGKRVKSSISAMIALQVYAGSRGTMQERRRHRRANLTQAVAESFTDAAMPHGRKG